jgi:hypothetical protein
MRRHADQHAVPRLDHVDRLHVTPRLAEDLVDKEVCPDEAAFVLEDRLLDRVEVVRLAQEADEIVPRAGDVDIDEDVAEVEEEGGGAVVEYEWLKKRIVWYVTNLSSKRRGCCDIRRGQAPPLYSLVYPD